MNKRGIRILPGGDYGFAWIKHGTNAKDLEYFVRYLGFTPMEALLAATQLGGEIMMRGSDLGQVSEGFLADLLLVDGDPLSNIARAAAARSHPRRDEGRRVPSRAGGDAGPRRWNLSVAWAPDDDALHRAHGRRDRRRRRRRADAARAWRHVEHVGAAAARRVARICASAPTFPARVARIASRDALSLDGFVRRRCARSRPPVSSARTWSRIRWARSSPQHLAAMHPTVVRSLALFGPLLAPPDPARANIRARGPEGAQRRRRGHAGDRRRAGAGGDVFDVEAEAACRGRLRARVADAPDARRLCAQLRGARRHAGRRHVADRLPDAARHRRRGRRRAAAGGAPDGRSDRRLAARACRSRCCAAAVTGRRSRCRTNARTCCAGSCAQQR